MSPQLLDLHKEERERRLRVAQQEQAAPPQEPTLREMVPGEPDQHEQAQYATQASRLETEIHTTAARVAAHSTAGAEVMDDVLRKTSEPGFFEQYVFGPLTYLSEGVARAFSGSELMRGGELLRRSGEGELGASQLRGFAGEEFGKSEFFRAPIGKFSGPESEGIINTAIVNWLDVKDDERPESFWAGVQGIMVESYNSKTIPRAIRAGAATAQTLSEVVLDTITDPLLFFSSLNPAMLTLKGGSVAMPRIRWMTRAEKAAALQAGRKTMAQSKKISPATAGETIVTQLWGHGAIPEWTRSTVRVGAAITSNVVIKGVEKVAGKKLAGLTKEWGKRAIVDVRDRMALNARMVDGLAFFRTMGRPVRMAANTIRHQYHGVMSMIPLQLRQDLTNSFTHAGLGMDRASRAKREFMTEALDEGLVMGTAEYKAMLAEMPKNTLVDIAKRGRRSGTITNVAGDVRGVVVDVDKLLAKRLSNPKYAKYIDEGDVPGLLEDTMRVRKAFYEIAEEEKRRGLLKSTLAHYVPHIFKNPAAYAKALRIGEGTSKGLVDDLGRPILPPSILPFAKHRKTEGILRKLKALNPEMDLLMLLQARKSHLLHNVAFQDYIQQLLYLGGREAMNHAPEAMKQGMSVVGQYGRVRKSLNLHELLQAKIFHEPMSESLFSVAPASGATFKGTRISTELVPLFDLVSKQSRATILRHPALQAAKAIGYRPDRIAIPRNLYAEIEKAMKRSSGFNNWWTGGGRVPLEYSGVGQVVEALTNWWRVGVTTMNPAFYAINVTGDWVRQFSELGVSALNPKRTADTIKILKGSPKRVTIGLGAHRIAKTGQEWLDELHQSGVQGNFEKRIDLNDYSSVGPFLRAGKQVQEVVGRPLRKLRELGTDKKLGQHMEEFSRSQMYLNARAMGMSPAQATDTTYNALFDYYHGLTSLERNYLRRAIPFYSFLRFNGAFQTKQAFRSPSRLILPERASRAAWAGTPEAQDDVPAVPVGISKLGEVDQELILKHLTFRDLILPYERTLTTFPLGTDKEGRQQVLGLRLTAKEFFNKLPRDLNLLNPESMRQWFDVLHPGLKAAINIVQGQDPNYGGRQRDYLQSDKFGVLFKNAPTRVREFLGLRESFQWGLGKRTYQIDPVALFTLTSVGLGRLMSTFGLLDQSYDLDVARIMHDEGMANAHERWTTSELTEIQAMVSAFLGMPLLPFGEKQRTVRRYERAKRIAPALRQKVRGLQALGKYPPPD